jgi:hypothetical protein
MTGGISTATETQNQWLAWGRVLRVAGFVVWVLWAFFLAYFWITQGFDGIPLGPALFFALVAPPLTWLSEWMIRRGKPEDA